MGLLLHQEEKANNDIWKAKKQNSNNLIDPCCWGCSLLWWPACLCWNVCSSEFYFETQVSDSLSRHFLVPLWCLFTVSIPPWNHVSNTLTKLYSYWDWRLLPQCSLSRCLVFVTSTSISSMQSKFVGIGLCKKDWLKLTSTWIQLSPFGTFLRTTSMRWVSMANIGTK